ncbi:uncharacterized protein FIBRA_09242 [Fibroporia radiculosa]|uniref:Uncharacterized protein n=1 Tax=Fibroporia radiculosa TaxID=599839 RepID=J7RVL4_9APHY|nr:uncharacterized protein FIBRA_09242 [Fibroporia radiculosa]CCM06930.1 predicted protein [Fibroporia radiculosa]
MNFNSPDRTGHPAVFVRGVGHRLLLKPAVLLLRPNVALYSTDALPVNCSAYSPPLDPESASPQASTSSSPFGSELGGARTCECLTQTLCCHSCGNAVGYMIVSPCRRCTSSISLSNRTTNGHRFVFYSAEVSAGERHYLAGERGVVPFHPVPPPMVSSGAQQLAGWYVRRPNARMAPYARDPVSGMPLQMAIPSPEPMSPPSADGETRFPSPDTESPGASSLSPSSSTESMPPLMDLDAPPPQHSPPVASASPSHVPNEPGSTSAESSVPPQRMQTGDVLFWHNLVRSGEIPAVVDNLRARGRSDGEDKGVDKEESAAVVPKRKVFAGR